MSKYVLGKTRKARKIYRKHEILSIDTILIIKEKLKQKILTKGPSYPKIKKWTKFFWHNKIFQVDPPKILSWIRKRDNKSKENPTKNWRHFGILNGAIRNHNKKARLIENIKDTYKNKESQMHE